MFNIRIVNTLGITIEVLESSISPVGMDSISTQKASYYPTEFSADYKANEIVVHVSDDILYFD